MNIRKLLLSAILFIAVYPLPVWSQVHSRFDAQEQNQVDTKVKVYGLVIDGKSQEPLELAQIKVMDDSSKFVAMTRAFEEGKFQFKIEPGTYTIAIIHTGYKVVKKRLTIGKEDVDLGTIKLTEGEEIEAAGVTAESLIRYEGDRISFDVTKDPDRHKINMMAMMEKIPQLKMSAKNGNLEFNGDQFETILIDNEENGIINRRRQYPMEFIKARYMNKIEVVLPGSLEYNNEKPILLITLQEKLPYGVAGQISANANNKNTYGSSLDAVVNAPAMGIGVGYVYSYAGEPALESAYEREMSDGTLYTGSTQSSSMSNSHKFNANAFTTFFDEEVRFNARLNGTMADGTSLSQTYSNGNFLSSTTGNIHSPFSLSAAARLLGYWGPKSTAERKSKGWSIDYSMNNSNDISNLVHSGDYGEIYQSTSKVTKEHRLQASMTMLRPKFFKKNGIISLTEGWYYRNIGDQSVYASDVRNMSYNQNVIFIKGNSIFPIIKNKLSGDISITAEGLFNRGQSFVDDKTTSLNSNIFNFIPDIGLNYAVTKRNSLSLKWSRSVKRPNFSMLSSLVDYSDPNNIRVGNPELKGQVSNTFNFAYTCYSPTKVIRYIKFNTGYTRTNNQMADIVETNQDGTSLIKTTNLGSSDALNCSASITLNPVKKMSVTANVKYAYLMTVLPSGMENHTGLPNGRLFFSWDPEIISLEGEFTIQPSTSSFQSKDLKMESYAAFSISKYFKKPHLGLSVSASDLLHRGGFMESWIYDTNFTQCNLQERRGRTFLVNVYWRFGKFKQAENIDVKAYDM